MGPWIESIVPEDSDFTINNLPWGVYKDDHTSGSICIAIGTYVLDVRVWALHWEGNKRHRDRFTREARDALLQASIFGRNLDQCT
jgi:hypothetical protein